MVSRPEFDLDAVYVIRRPLAMGGRLFQPGDEFPWRELEMTEYRLWQWWRFRRLGTAEEAGVSTKSEPRAEEPDREGYLSSDDWLDGDSD